MNLEIDRLTQICDIIDDLQINLKAIDDHYEYERVQNYISSKYGIDLPLTQGE